MNTPSQATPGSEDRTVAFDVVHLPDGRVVFARTVTPEDTEAAASDVRIVQSEPLADEIFATWQAAMKERIEATVEPEPILVEEGDLEVEEPTLIDEPLELVVPPPTIPPPPVSSPSSPPSASSSSLWAVSLSASSVRQHMITFPPSVVLASEPPPARDVPTFRTPPEDDGSTPSFSTFSPRTRVVARHAIIGLLTMFVAAVSSVGTAEALRFYRGEATAALGR